MLGYFKDILQYLNMGNYKVKIMGQIFVQNRPGI